MSNRLYREGWTKDKLYDYNNKIQELKNWINKYE